MPCFNCGGRPAKRPAAPANRRGQPAPANEDDMILIEFRAGAAQVPVRGPSGTDYGHRSGGERFHVLREDAAIWPGVFVPVRVETSRNGRAPEQFAVRPRPQRVAQPPALPEPPPRPPDALVTLPSPDALSVRALKRWLDEHLSAIEASMDFEALQDLFNKEAEGQNRASAKKAIQQAGAKLGIAITEREPLEA